MKSHVILRGLLSGAIESFNLPGLSDGRRSGLSSKKGHRYRKTKDVKRVFGFLCSFFLSSLSDPVFICPDYLMEADEDSTV